MTDITDAVARVTAERIQRDIMPYVDMVTVAATGLPIRPGTFSPRSMAAHAVDSIKAAANSARYYATQFAVLSYYTFK